MKARKVYVRSFCRDTSHDFEFGEVVIGKAYAVAVVVEATPSSTVGLKPVHISAVVDGQAGIEARHKLGDSFVLSGIFLCLSPVSCVIIYPGNS